jgi:hypothetical protein
MASLNQEVLAELKVSSDREAQLRRLVVSDPQGTARKTCITERSLQELVDSLMTDMVAGLKERHLTGITFAFMFILGPTSHWEFVAIKATIKATCLTHELIVIDP